MYTYLLKIIQNRYYYLGKLYSPSRLGESHSTPNLKGKNNQFQWHSFHQILLTCKVLRKYEHQGGYIKNALNFKVSKPNLLFRVQMYSKKKVCGQILQQINLTR